MPFVLFGPAHLIVLALTFAVPGLLGGLARASRNVAVDRAIRWAFAALLIATWILWFWLIFASGWQSPQTILPMHLCDWATIAALITLLRPNQRTYELAYFWALAGTLQAMLTPDLAYGFPDLRFIVFFAFHGGVIAAVLYLTFGSALRPHPSSLPRVFGWSLFYVAAAATVDWVFKVNFGYLRAKPAQASVLDYMAPWPWYIAELAAIGALSILVYYAPFFIADRIRARKT